MLHSLSASFRRGDGNEHERGFEAVGSNALRTREQALVRDVCLTLGVQLRPRQQCADGR